MKHTAKRKNFDAHGRELPYAILLTRQTIATISKALRVHRAIAASFFLASPYAGMSADAIKRWADEADAEFRKAVDEAVHGPRKAKVVAKRREERKRAERVAGAVRMLVDAGVKVSPQLMALSVVPAAKPFVTVHAHEALKRRLVRRKPAVKK